ncbi:hypothetical protein PR048_000838 [Dryococelus australis]|uniref:Uncharacterized protein n=1 Tax=Dryococelus australis TaxID=614101 RepID=A0ABQ9IFR2_9NEOP|nr:hypothetical protein PR048_000838 [Dryococelus australis]
MESNASAPWMDRTSTENILRVLEKDQSLSITDYHVKDISTKGDQYMSEMHQITIQLQPTSSKERKVSLIAKKLPPGKEKQKKLSESSAFPNEIKIFRRILPKFQAILEDAAPGRSKIFAARHIYSQNNIPYFLIVSDLAAEGFRMATFSKVWILITVYWPGRH